MCDGWIDVLIWKRREKKEEEKKPGTNFGGNQASLKGGRRKRGSCRFSEGKPALAQERLRRGRFGRSHRTASVRSGMGQ